MATDTNQIRRSVLRLVRKYDDKFIVKFSDDVMALCDECDEANSLQSIIEAGQTSIDHSFSVLERLRNVASRG